MPEVHCDRRGGLPQRAGTRRRPVRWTARDGIDVPDRLVGGDSALARSFRWFPAGVSREPAARARNAVAAAVEHLDGGRT